MTGNSVSMSGTGHRSSRSAREREDKRSVHIKKPLNAFMLYMKEMRPKIVAECTLKESAAINQILGRRVRVVLNGWWRGTALCWCGKEPCRAMTSNNKKTQIWWFLFYFSGTALVGKNKPSITSKRVKNANYICKCILVGQPETITLKVKRRNGNESRKQHHHRVGYHYHRLAFLFSFLTIFECSGDSSQWTKEMPCSIWLGTTGEVV